MLLRRKDEGSALLAEIPFLGLLVAPLLLDYSIPQTRRLSFSADTRLKLEIARWEKGCRLLSGEDKTSNGESNRAQKSFRATRRKGQQNAKRNDICHCVYHERLVVRR